MSTSSRNCVHIARLLLTNPISTDSSSQKQECKVNTVRLLILMNFILGMSGHLTGGMRRTKRKTLTVARHVCPTGLWLSLHSFTAGLAIVLGAKSRTATASWAHANNKIGKSVKIMTMWLQHYNLAQPSKLCPTPFQPAAGLSSWKLDTQNLCANCTNATAQQCYKIYLQTSTQQDNVEASKFQNLRSILHSKLTCDTSLRLKPSQ